MASNKEEQEQEHQCHERAHLLHHDHSVRQLEEDVKNGANGLKIYKSLGLRNNDIYGDRIPVNDKRLDPIWAKCGELGIPVLIHSADPKPFWDPHDEKNERWLELKLRPGRKRAENDRNEAPGALNPVLSRRLPSLLSSCCCGDDRKTQS